MRLDLYLVQKGYCRSRDRAKVLISDGKCVVNGQKVTKPAYKVQEGDELRLEEEDFPYVSRGGLKLEAGLECFQLQVEGKVALDVGVATGGFTDLLLRQGVRKVYAVDVGKGQLDEALQNDERVIFMPEKDARTLQPADIPEPLDLVVVDVSFISVTAMLQALRNCGQPTTDYVFLIKPQFETGKPHSGVLKDPQLIETTLQKVHGAFDEAGFHILDAMESPIKGKEGNREFLWHVRWR